jgi:hypothetical protein
MCQMLFFFKKLSSRVCQVYKSNVQIPILKCITVKWLKVIHDEKLLINYSGASLIRLALSWSMGIDDSKIKKWEYLAYIFLKYFGINLKVTPTRSSFQRTLEN